MQPISLEETAILPAEPLSLSPINLAAQAQILPAPPARRHRLPLLKAGLIALLVLILPGVGYQTSLTGFIKSVKSMLRKVTQAHKMFPSDDAVYKVLYLAAQNITKRWIVPIKNWKQALNWFALAYSERMPQSGVSG